MKLKANRVLSGIFYTKRHVLKFESNQEIISEEDILDLFIGLVRLIRRSAEVSIEEKYQRELNDLKRELTRIKNNNI